MSHKPGHKLKKEQKKRTKSWQKRSKAKGVQKPRARKCIHGICKNPGSRTAAERKRDRERKKEARVVKRGKRQDERSSSKKKKPSSNNNTSKAISSRKKIFKRKKKEEVVLQKSKNPRFL